MWNLTKCLLDSHLNPSNLYNEFRGSLLAFDHHISNHIRILFTPSRGFSTQNLYSPQTEFLISKPTSFIYSINSILAPPTGSSDIRMWWTKPPSSLVSDFVYIEWMLSSSLNTMLGRWVCQYIWHYYHSMLTIRECESQMMKMLHYYWSV